MWLRLRMLVSGFYDWVDLHVAPDDELRNRNLPRKMKKYNPIVLPSGRVVDYHLVDINVTQIRPWRFYLILMLGLRKYDKKYSAERIIEARDQEKGTYHIVWLSPPYDKELMENGLLSCYGSLTKRFRETLTHWIEQRIKYLRTAHNVHAEVKFFNREITEEELIKYGWMRREKHEYYNRMKSEEEAKENKQK